MQVEITIENFGQVVVELNKEVAPQTVENFLKLVNENFYQRKVFHRIIRNFMIQGGGFDAQGKYHEAANIKGEFDANNHPNNLKHLRGVISMARASDPNSASSQFFIVHQDSPHLDGQYAAFGQVVKGMFIVDKIAALPTSDRDVPVRPVVISAMKRWHMEKIIVVANEQWAAKQLAVKVVELGFKPIMIEELEPDFYLFSSNGYRQAAIININNLVEKHRLPVIYAFISYEFKSLRRWPSFTIESVKRQLTPRQIEDHATTRLGVVNKRQMQRIAVLAFGKYKVVFNTFRQEGFATSDISGPGEGLERFFCPRGRKIALNRLSEEEKEKFNPLTKLLEETQLEYSEVNEYTYVDVTVLQDKVIAKEDFIAVYGNDGCAACRSFKTVIADYISKYHQKIYYFASEMVSSLSQNERSFINSIFDTRGTPAISFIVDGELVSKVEYSSRLDVAAFWSLASKYYITGPRMLSLEQVRQKRDAGENFVLLIARPDCGTCQMFYKEIFNEYLYQFVGEFLMFNTAPYRDPTVVTPTNPTPRQEDIDLYNNIREELQFNWTPTLVVFKNNRIEERFQWLDGNYLSSNNDYKFIYYDEMEYEGKLLSAIPTTDRQLEGKEYSSYQKKVSALIKHYNKQFVKWISNYYK
ncbi:peptidyl-prolyl cis-trans isomerase-related [Holotrichia oblita]|nr:peptidyl-prolyl cis-trans isomerase-related [Holotrichia oblita]